MCRWMGSHFYNWTDYNANFRDFWDKKILVSRDLKKGIKNRKIRGFKMVPAVVLIFN